MTILLADDSALVRQRLFLLIGRLVPRAQLLEAGTLASIRALIRSHKPDLIVLDSRFPDGMGYELLRELRGSAGRVPVFVLTNYATPEYRSLYTKEGADRFYDKSSDIEALLCDIELIAGLLAWAEIT